MKVGIMQPYFVPYIGYWQLMNLVDKYVIYDDVNFIKGGWVNRNRIVNNGKIQFFNVPMVGASPNKLINEVQVNTNPNIQKKNLRIIEAAYRKAPYYSDVYPVLEKIICSSEETLASYLISSIYSIADYLNIKTEFIVSSSIEKNNELRGQDKVLEICEKTGSTEYYNAIGGMELYSKNDFSDRGIVLKFVRTKPTEYKQFSDEYYPNLSIIDVMMFNDIPRIREMLESYSIE